MEPSVDSQIIATPEIPHKGTHSPDSYPPTISQVPQQNRTSTSSKSLPSMTDKGQGNTSRETTRFTLFPELPTEIRLKIWRECSKFGGEIVLNGYYETDDPTYMNEVSFEGTDVALSYIRDKHYFAQGCEFRALEPKHRQPAVLNINHESRTEGLKIYKRFGECLDTTGGSGTVAGKEESVESTGPKSYYNPTADTFILKSADPFLEPLRDGNVHTQDYPMVSALQNIESLIYINIEWSDPTSPKAEFHHHSEIKYYCQARRKFRFARLHGTPPWIWFRNLKSLVLKQAYINQTIRVTGVEPRKWTSTEIARELEMVFESLKEEDPSRSVPRITVQLEDED